ncbi:MAG: hypothetical protein RL247_508 [Actinomycetota bacterium]
MTELRVSLAQYAPVSDVHENLRALRALVGEAAAHGSDLIVFPEYSHTFSPGLGDAWAQGAEDFEGEFVQGLTEASLAHEGIMIVAGMLRRGQDGARPTNTVVAVSRGGVVAYADKIHLYDAFGATESQWISPGSVTDPRIVECSGFRLGFLACYDLRFPEVARRLGDAGADVLVVPAQWVPGDHKLHHWRTLLAARAIENQTFVLAAGHPEPHGIGHSQVLDPLGEVVVEAAGSSTLIHAVLKGELLDSTRSRNPMTSARRFGVTAL